MHEELLFSNAGEGTARAAAEHFELREKHLKRAIDETRLTYPRPQR